MFDVAKFARRSAKVSREVMRADRETTIQSVTKGIISSYEETDLGEVKGIGEETQKILFDKGIYSQADLKRVGLSKIEEMKINHFALRGIKAFLKENN